MTQLNNAKVWIDLVSPSHPFLFRALVDALPIEEPSVTVRKKTETIPLAEDVGFEYSIVGRDFDHPLVRKLGIPLRTAQLSVRMPACDVSVSSRNAMCIIASKVRGVPSIHFTDNDITHHVDGLTVEEQYNRLEARATHNVVPKAFATEELTKWGADSRSIHTYNGYKEDIYVANFEPDPAFLNTLPFEEYVVVRPEAMTAAYVDASHSIVPDLLAEIVTHGFNVVYLPRGRGDESFADRYPSDTVFVPETALNGLQLAWHSDCVLTGSGTMAREAASMGKPAVSFFPNTLLSVDQELVKEGRMMRSRNPEKIGEYLESLQEPDVRPDLRRAKRVRREVATLTERLIQSETGGSSTEGSDRISLPVVETTRETQNDD